MVKNRVFLIVCFFILCGCSSGGYVTPPIDNAAFSGKQVYFDYTAETLPINEAEIEFFQVEKQLICWYNSADGIGNIRVFSLDSGEQLFSYSTPGGLVNIYNSKDNGIIIIGANEASYLSLSAFTISDIPTFEGKATYGYDFSRINNIVVSAKKDGVALTNLQTSETTELISQLAAFDAVQKKFSNTTPIPPEAMPYFSSPRLVYNDRFVVLSITLPMGQTTFGGFCLIDLETNKAKYYVEDSGLGGKVTITDDDIISFISVVRPDQLILTQVILPDFNEKKFIVDSKSYDGNVLINLEDGDSVHWARNEGAVDVVFLDSERRNAYRRFSIDAPDIEGLLFTHDLFLFYTLAENSRNLVAYLF